MLIYFIMTTLDYMKILQRYVELDTHTKTGHLQRVKSLELLLLVNKLSNSNKDLTSKNT